MNRPKSVLALVAITLLLFACGTSEVSESTSPTTVTYDDSDVVEIVLDSTTATSASDSVSIDGSTVVIDAEGVYSLIGTLDDGAVIVEASESDDVTLILNGVDITNADGAAIAFITANESAVVLAEGSTNTLTDGATYVFPDAETDEPNATLYARTDLTIGGDGELVVNANYNDGITSKDSLEIEGGSITVDSVDDGIRGRDQLLISGGTISVNAGGDALKADNDEDADRGIVQIEAGVVNLVAGDDGIAAFTNVLIAGGTTDIASQDDAINSSNEVTVDQGTLTLAAGDDGIHADYNLTINGGEIGITQSFEGLESEVITINDGAIDITSSDDGINVADADSVAVVGNGGRGQRGGDEGVGEHYVYINGGTTSITVTGDLDEQGDGIDANGFVEMTGGTVTVSGPTDTRNSAVDYSGGGFEITGGTFIGTHIDGRNSEDIDGGSQASIYVTGPTMSAGEVIEIESAGGETLATFEPANDYSVILFSSSDLVAGESYDVYLSGSLAGTVQAV